MTLQFLFSLLVIGPVNVALVWWLVLSIRDLRDARRERRMRTARLEQRLARDEGISVEQWRANFDAAISARYPGLMARIAAFVRGAKVAP